MKLPLHSTTYPLTIRLHIVTHPSSLANVPVSRCSGAGKPARVLTLGDTFWHVNVRLTIPMGLGQNRVGFGLATVSEAQRRRPDSALSQTTTELSK